jgi:hypothetical protein
MSSRSKTTTNALIVIPVLILSALILGPVIVIYFTAYFIFRGALYMMVWLLWCTQGKHALFIYSDSPVWKEHIETSMIPRFSDKVVILNWSERKRWKTSLATLLFSHFGGGYEFNPMTLVFRPFHRRTEFRFFKAFQAFKKGNPNALQAIESEFFLTLRSMRLLKEVEQASQPNI